MIKRKIKIREKLYKKMKEKKIKINEILLKNKYNKGKNIWNKKQFC